MFFLKDLPDNYDILENIIRPYTEDSTSSVMAYIVLMRLGTDLQLALEKNLKPYGLSRAGYVTLVVLNHSSASEVTVSELADRVGVTRATMTGILNTLLKKDFVDRYPHTMDRRSLLVRIRQKGVKLINQISPKMFNHISEFANGLTEEEKKEMIGLLLLYNKGFKKTRNG